MLFKLPVVALSALAFVGLVASSPIAEADSFPALVARNNSGSGGGKGSGSGSGSGSGGSGGGGAPGPSGQLLKPAGGDFIFTYVDWPGAGFNFVYKPVYKKNPDPNCVNQRQACYAETRWLQVDLVRDFDSATFNLVNYLHNDLDNPSANIDTWLGVPQDATCGNYQVRVIEHQRYYNQWVSFQSAAPTVTMQCVRYSGPGE